MPCRLQVSVELTTTSLAVAVDEQPLLGGALYREIKRDESTWYIQVIPWVYTTGYIQLGEEERARV